jgi:hypothetical protein
MEKQYDFRKWVAAITLTILSRLLFLGEGVESMTPNTWIFWIVLSAGIFVWLIYPYVRDNLVLAWEAMHKRSESKLLFPPGTDLPTPSRRAFAYTQPFVILAVTLVFVCGSIGHTVTVYKTKVASREKRDGINDWFIRWSDFHKSLSRDRTAPTKEFQEMQEEFRNFTKQYLSKAEIAILETAPREGGIKIRNFGGELGEIDHSVEVLLGNLKILMRE